jgi:ATP-binding cassette subfamily B protein/subfamily B ATP-binding cassette protein MsbA
MGAIGRRLKATSLLAQRKLGETTSQMEETLGGLRIVKAFIAEKKMSARFEKCSNELRSATIRVATRQASAHPVSEFLGTCVIVIVLWFGGTLIFGDNSPISAASFIYYLTILYSVINPLKELSRASYCIPRGLASMERVDEILKAENNITDGEKGIVIPEMKEGIEFKNLNFSYDGERDVLKNINLKIEKGKTVALVGQSGSGKSTLVDLLPRYYDIEQGEITIDGKPLKSYDREYLRKNIAMVLQDTHLFTGSVMENIRYGRLDATDEEVIAAAKTASAHSFIMRLADGYNTVLEGDGANLSQGQRQLINIARAALSKAPILVLDEATSSVDTRTERHIEKGMDRLMSNRTTFVIAHRLSTVRNSNAIMVLEKGEIIERGTHEQLLEMKGRYYELYTGKRELD